jgi:hypothetical protein
LEVVDKHDLRKVPRQRMLSGDEECVSQQASRRTPLATILAPEQEILKSAGKHTANDDSDQTGDRL